ncbi:MAG: S8 family serine peptidase, partial [Chthoniobacterales bacterium]
GVFLSIKPETDSIKEVDPTVYLPSRKVESLRNVATPEASPGDTLRRLGTAFDQGVTQHRIDRINQYYNPSAPVNYNGAGISVGALSDSYNTSGNAISAAVDVANFDLPGSASHPVGNSQPVVVLQDSPGGTDEGRGMLQNVHKMAPGARLAFATGNLGPVFFGNNIRALAALPGFAYPPATQQGFKADVIVDDLSTIGEPFYGESVVGAAIDDVAAAGVAYYSSAGNNIGTNGYESALRLVANGSGNTAATNSALAGTNIDLTGVPPELYSGGFHNFNPNPGQLDVAALWNMPSGTTAQTEMQWDDPFDPADPPLDQPPVYQNTGTIDASNGATGVSFTVPFTASKAYFIDVRATSGDFDAIVSVIDPAGNTIVSQDTGTDEQLLVGPQTSGNFQIHVDRFANTTGSFSITVNTTNPGSTVTTDLNLLVFRADNGAYFGARSLYQNNIATNRPDEYGVVRSPAGQTQCQFVVAKGVATRNLSPLPSRLRIQTRGNGAGGIGPAEYVQYNAPTSKGHATAAGGNGTAAYSPFRPSLPETFTSPGSALILFDKMGNRLAQPVIRLYPTVAAINRANTSFFGGDSTNDPDTRPEFSGTSSAAPHAAGLAALVLQAHGGPGSVTPTQMRSVLQRSAFPHDLDTNYSAGTARATNGAKVTVTISSDNSSNAGQGSNDLNSMQVAYVGPGSIASITFNPNGLATEGGNVSGGNNGVLDVTPATNPPTVTYFANSFPGAAFLPGTRAFALGTLTGLTAADVQAPQSATPFTGFSNPVPTPPGNGTQFRTMTIGFPTGNFSGGKIVRFTVGRGVEHSAVVGNGAAFNPGATGGTVASLPTGDIFGGGVLIPENVVIQDGMKFSGTLTGGGTFQGVIRNRVGNGYSNVDGFGLINAESAVMLPLQ